MRTSSIKGVLHFEGNPFGNERMRHAFLGDKVLKAFSPSHFQTQYILKNKINILSFTVWQILSFIFCPLISDKVSRWVTQVPVCAHSGIMMFSAQLWEQKTVLFNGSGVAKLLRLNLCYECRITSHAFAAASQPLWVTALAVCSTPLCNCLSSLVTSESL